MSEGTGKPAPDAEEITADESSFARTLVQFFLVPAVVVAACVSVFLFFAWLVSDEKTGVDYLQEIRMGSASRRWQAAFELSKRISMDTEKSRREGLVPEMIAAFESAGEDDPRVRHYLALSLGHLGDPSAAPILIRALEDPDSTTRLYASWALGNFGDRSAVEPLIAKFGDPDPGVRKMAVYAAGALKDERARSGLRVALGDPDRDVSWNAAVALAQLGDASGESQLLLMLDREFLDGLTDIDEARKLLAMQSAIQASALLASAPLDERLSEIAGSDPNLSIRKLAIHALEGRER
ncbi:MAG TPA: HEAT repeat domain-containing protein [Vicinamibacteria bacterium]